MCLCQQEATDPEEEEEEYKEALQLQATLANAASPPTCPYLITTQFDATYEDNVIDFSKVKNYIGRASWRTN